MIKTKGTLLKRTDVPASWGYPFYLQDCPPLTGQDVMLRSPFRKEKVESFSVYRKNGGEYRWYDFGMSEGGDVVDLVARLRSKDDKYLPWQEAFKIVQQDYKSGNNYDGPKSEFKLNTKGKVTAFELRRWKNSDLAFWARFGITKPTLERYNVSPIRTWRIEKIINGEHKVMDFDNPLAFAYMTKQGELGKIYQPGMGKSKYIKVIERLWIQGMDQLEYKGELLIKSGLKDGMAFVELQIPGYEFIAADGEGIMIKKETMLSLKEKYPRIRVWMDNDEAGKKAATKYKDLYQLENIPFDLEKDLAEAVEKHGQLTKIKVLQAL